MNSPRMRRFGKLLLVVFALACVLTTAAFAEGDAEVVSAVHGTIASLLPPVVAIGLALITKEVYSSLFLGILVGCFLQVNGNPIDAFQFFVSHLCSNAGGNMGILMFLVILGTMVALMIRAGGSKAYGDWAVSHIKTKSGALWSTFILAIVLGVDDYFNNLTTGNVMRPVADGHHISRAKLSYMCDATAAPVCIMTARLLLGGGCHRYHRQRGGGLPDLPESHPLQLLRHSDPGVHRCDDLPEYRLRSHAQA